MSRSRAALNTGTISLETEWRRPARGVPVGRGLSRGRRDAIDARAAKQIGRRPSTARPVDVEAVRARVVELGQLHEVPEFFPRPTTDDGHRRPITQFPDGVPHMIGQRRGVGVRHDRCERPIVI